MQFRPLLATLVALIVAAVLPSAAEQAAEQAAEPEAEQQMAQPAAPAELALGLAADGTLSASGVLPPGLSPDALTAALPGIAIVAAAAAITSAPGSAAAWQPALDALSIVMPRFRTAAVRLEQGTLEISGQLKSGLSASGAEAALRAALGTGWQLGLDLAETAPPAEIVLVKSGDGIVVSGLLPRGLEPAAALELLGTAAGDAGLAGGGEGSAADWSRALSALSGTLDLFGTATARVAEGSVTVAGVLHPGYPALTVAERQEARLPQGWAAELDATDTPASEGDRRVGLASGEPETFRRGYWLPDVGFPVSAARCRTEADAILARDELPFAAGSSEIEAHGLPLLNRLAAIAVRCLNSSSLRLEVGGHTDSVGNDARNEALSRDRAEAVRRALVDRGVRADAVTASGYGESRPIATNNTPDGRALNRRITFAWTEAQG